jgi:hypothetical protein
VPARSGLSRLPATSRGTPASNTGIQLAIAEVWNGSTWRLSKMIPSKSYSNLDTVSCLTVNSKLHCLLGGYYFTTQGGLLLAENFDGAHWSSVTVAAPSPASGYVDYISGISCSATTSCVAVGQIGKLVSSTSVTSTGFTEVLSAGAWHTHKVAWPSGKQSALYAVSCVSAAYCVAVGTEGPFNGNSGHSITGFYDGTTWTQYNLP